MQVLVWVPAAPHAVAEQAPQPLQPPLRGLEPVQDRVALPAQSAPPHPGDGSVQVLVWVPVAPHAVAEQAPQPLQPPLRGLDPVHASFCVPLAAPEQAAPPQDGAGLVQLLDQLRLRVPLWPQAMAEHAPHPP